VAIYLKQSICSVLLFAVLETSLGAIGPEVIVAKAEFAFVLSLRARLGFDEGLSLQRRLIVTSILLGRGPRLLLFQAQHAGSFIRDGKVNGAFQCLD